MGEGLVHPLPGHANNTGPPDLPYDSEGPAGHWQRGDEPHIFRDHDQNGTAGTYAILRRQRVGEGGAALGNSSAAHVQPKGSFSVTVLKLCASSHAVAPWTVMDGPYVTRTHHVAETKPSVAVGSLFSRSFEPFSRTRGMVNNTSQITRCGTNMTVHLGGRIRKSHSSIEYLGRRNHATPVLPCHHHNHRHRRRQHVRNTPK